MPDDVFIIIPCYNESAVIRQTVEQLLPLGHQIVIVDDGSAQSPWPQLQDLPVHFLRHPVNLGQGAALQTGMDYAKARHARAVIHFDADGQHDANDIPRFLAALDDGADVVIGSRFLRPEDVKRIPATKRCILRAARIVNGLFTHVWLSDAHNGFRALNRNALDKIRLTENRMAHATEIVAQIKTHRLVIRELPTAICYSDYARAKGQKWYHAFNILIDLILNKIL
jgi:glycosyltransferase involved in cell wall biosynthesis